MAYLLRRKDQGSGSRWVACAEYPTAYTRDRSCAKRYPTREAAEADRCGNELIEQE